MKTNTVRFIHCAGFFGWLVLALLAWPGGRLNAATRHVNAATGSDLADGLAATRALKTIQQAARLVQPGDTVVVAPGVYFESVEMTRSGTAAAPITFRADQVARGRVVVTGADRGLRTGQTAWRLENAGLGLYSAPLSAAPATVLYGDTDLFGYASVAELQGFRIANVNNTGRAAPGPRHGFAWAEGRLWVRLHASGRYGPANPAQQVIKVSPPRAAGFRGDVITKASDYNFAVKTATPAYVVLDGFTFESPGFTGVWVQHGQVTVRNCWFTGCRTGVRGWLDSENIPAQRSADVTVENCDYSEFPTFDDVVEVVQAAEALPAAERAALPTFFWWHRKGGVNTHEIGLVCAAGVRWKIRGNFIHETIDGLSYLALGNSDQVEISGNRFERLVDNAVECENHASNLRVHRNYVVDAYEPFSYQPGSGVPFPASVSIYKNVVFTRPEVAAFWRKPLLAWTPGCFKIKTPWNFTAAPLEGFAAYNNTLFFPGGNALILNSNATVALNFRFLNNIAVTAGLEGFLPKPLALPNMQLRNNFSAPDAAGNAGPGAVFAGSAGRTFANYAQIGMVGLGSADFALRADSAALGAGVVVANLPESSADVGALGRGQSWQPPQVGPRTGSGAPPVVAPPTTPPPATPAPATPPPSTPRPATPAPATPVPATPPPAPPTGVTTSVVDDAFTDSLRSDGADVRDVNWWTIEASSGGVTPLLSIANDSAGLGTGNALHVENGGAGANPYSTKAIVAPFPTCALTTVGDRLVLRFDFRFVRILADDPLNVFRFGLYHANGSVATGDKQTANYNDSGYTAGLTYGALGGGAAFTQEAGAPNTTLFEEDLLPLGTPFATAFSVGATAAKRTAVFTATRTTAGLTLRAQILSDTGALLLDGTTEDTLAPVVTFNQIVIGTKRMEADYRLDNVRVDFTRAAP